MAIGSALTARTELISTPLLKTLSGAPLSIIGHIQEAKIILVKTEYAKETRGKEAAVIIIIIIILTPIELFSS